MYTDTKPNQEDTVHASRRWLIRWLYGAAAMHVVAGIALPWIAELPAMSWYHQQIEQAFWMEPAPTAARVQQIWWMGLFGATLQTVGLCMAGLIYLGDRHRSAAAWMILLVAILVWAPQDILISLQASAWMHVAIDGFALIALVPPLLWLYRLDRRRMR